MTGYVVLQRDSDGAWREITTVDGRDDRHAIQAATSDLPSAEKTGTFVAVPARSFKPRTRTVQAVEKDVWS